MWFYDDKPYKGTHPDDPLDIEDPSAYAEGWFDAMACILWVLIAVIAVYVLVPLLNPAWSLL